MARPGRPLSEIWVESVNGKNLEEIKPIVATIDVWNRLIKTGAVRLYLYIFLRATFFKNNLVMKTSWRDIANDIGISTSTLHRYKQLLHELKVLVTIQSKYGIYLIVRPQLDEEIHKSEELKKVIEEYHADQKRNKPLPDKKAERRHAFRTAPNPQDNLKTPIGDVITNNIVGDSKVEESPIVKKGDEKQGDKNNISKTVNTGLNEEKESKGTGTLGRKVTERVKGKQTKMFEEPKFKIDWPCKVSEVRDSLLPQIPLRGKGVHVSAVWYWALRRLEKHRLDFEFTMRSFQLLVTKYYKYVVKSVGKDWEANRKYIDWYLNNNDPFIAKTCQYNPHFLTSVECLNKWHAATPQAAKIIETHEERQETGEWVK